MDLRSKIPIETQKYDQIDYNSHLLLLGSCFSVSIGDKFEYFKFRNLLNPFGILYHPLAIEQLVLYAVNGKRIDDDELIASEHIWQSFDAHSSLGSADKQQAIENLNKAVEWTHSALTTATHIFITYGTAWVYRHIATDKIVANCHKVPQKEFSKELLGIQEISESIRATEALIRSVNHDARIVFTISPVRHLRDGFTENNRSKANLISALHEVVDERNKTHYFPSYEIVMDELRDYRFFERDMVHPNSLAIEYIWNKLKECWISQKSFSTMSEVESIQKGMAHKPFNRDSESHIKFRSELKKKQISISEKFPHIAFD